MACKTSSLLMSSDVKNENDIKVEPDISQVSYILSNFFHCSIKTKKNSVQIDESIVNM